MQKLQLSIPEPCHESWQQMTPTEQGRFCNACAKEVIDFSTMTDIQVLNYFTNMTHEKVCGRALPEQLDRTLSRPEHPKKKIFWYWNYIVMFLMFFTKGNSGKAQSCTKPATELTPAKNVELRGDVVVKGKVATDVRQRLLTGKVADKNGNPVPFVSIRIKGTNTGVSADATGKYSVKVNSNNTLIISAAGFKELEVLPGAQSFLNSVLERDERFLGGEVVVTVAGGIRRKPVIESAIIKPVFFFKVKDDNTELLIDNATITIISEEDYKSDTAANEKKGIYKFNKFDEDETYLVKVEAPNYKANEFTIDGSDFKDRKKEWNVMLKKKKDQLVKSQGLVISGTDDQVRLRGMMIAHNKDTGPIYVVDGTIMPNGENINPDNVDNITVLQGPAAAALFGYDGRNGAIVITTKKLPVKNLDTVTVSAFSNRVVGRLTTTTSTTTSVMGGMTKGITVKSTISDTLKMMATKITGAIKIYPNPVQRGRQFSIALKLKEAGLYQLQVTDVAGRIVLQKQINANAKQVTEKIMADSHWSAGIYYVSIINNKNQLTGKTSFIFE